MAFFFPWAEFWYNTTYHTSTRMILFQALYGRPPPTIPRYRQGYCPVNEVYQSLASRGDSKYRDIVVMLM